MKMLDKPTFRLLERSLDAASLRQKVIANNIANVDTPLFKRSDVRFEELLQQSISSQTISGFRTDPRHFTIGSESKAVPSAQIIRDDSTIMNNNLNNVDIDYEMTLMAKNQLRYNAMTDLVNGSITKLKTAIDRRG